jgi:hypothetical protein
MKFNWFKKSLAQLLWKVFEKTSLEVPTNTNKYPDLCPTDDAQYAEAYIDRLNELLGNRRNKVLEIAITAPYSGGKSSVIQTYFRKNQALNYSIISLTDYKEQTRETEEGENEKLPQIEKSIIQQLLYRTSSKQSPNSRFRRIFPKPISWVESYSITVPIILWLGINILISKTEVSSYETLYSNLISNHSFSSIYIWLFSFLLAVPIVSIKSLYKYLTQFTLTKLNPLKGDIAFSNGDVDSIFNKYLEEIIYHFSTQKTDVIIFEDLDRFNKTKIFVKLQELNKLINDSKDVTQPVRFIYALKDDVFKGKDRTKFFDSMIPIIPIAHSANSYPQLKKLIKNADITDDLSDVFLRDISVYLDDMRMLKNIVAEYGIYRETLSKTIDDLDWQKLFAFIIYKNVYCDDFAALNHNKGKLATFFKSLRKSRSVIKDTIKVKAEEIEKQILDSDNELSETIEQLYALATLRISKKINPSTGLICGYNLPQLYTEEIFNKLSESDQQITLTVSNRNQNTNYFFRQVRDEVYPHLEVEVKKVRDKTSYVRNGLRLVLSDLNKELSEISSISIKELCSKSNRDEIFSELKSMELLIHMIEQGFIDQHYHLYISHFHEGLMTKNDMDFVSLIKNKKNVEPSYPINNCSQTLEYFSTDDFKSTAIINYDIIQYLLGKKEGSYLVTIIQSSFQLAKEPLPELFKSFVQISDYKIWLCSIVIYWENIVPTVLQSNKVKHEDKQKFCVDILSSLDRDITQNVINAHKQVLKNFLDENESISYLLPDEEKQQIDLFKSFSDIGVKFQLLDKCATNKEFLTLVLKFEVSEVDELNLALLFNNLKSTTSTLNNKKVDFSELTYFEDNNLQKLIQNNLNKIVERVCLGHIEISKTKDIYELLNNPAVLENNKLNIIDNLDFKLQSLNISPIESKYLIKIIDVNKLSATWDNVIKLLENSEIEQKTIVKFINNSANQLHSLKEKLPELYNPDLLLILSNDTITPEAFADCYINSSIALDANNLKNLNNDKLDKIFTDNLINFDESFFDIAVSVSIECMIAFITNNISEFEKHLGSINVTNELFQVLVKNNKIPDETKHKIIEEYSNHINWNTNDFELIRLTMNNDIIQYNLKSTSPRLSTESLTKLFDTKIPNDNKIRIYVGQLNFLSVNERFKFLELLNHDISTAIENKSYCYIEYNEEAELLANSLKYFGMISSFSVEKKKRPFASEIRINSKRS